MPNLYLMGGAALIIGLLGWLVVSQAKDLGNVEGKLEASEASVKQLRQQAKDNQEASDNLSKTNTENAVYIERLKNERDIARQTADNRAQDNPVDFGDAAERDIALWMLRVETGSNNPGNPDNLPTTTPDTPPSDSGPE